MRPPGARPSPRPAAVAPRSARGVFRGIGGKLGWIGAAAAIATIIGGRALNVEERSLGHRDGPYFQPSSGRWIFRGGIYNHENPASIPRLLGPATQGSYSGLNYWDNISQNLHKGIYYYGDTYLEPDRTFGFVRYAPLGEIVPPQKRVPDHWPAFDPFQNPGYNPSPGLEPARQPRTRPQRNARTNYQRGYQLGPRGGIKPILAVNRRPGRGTSERKLRSNKKWYHAIPWLLWEARESAQDFINDLYKAAGGPSGASYREKVEWLFIEGNVADVNIEDWLQERQQRIAEDRIFGYLDQVRRYAAEFLDRPIDIGIPDLPLPDLGF